jgi:hypothetical protein
MINDEIEKNQWKKRIQKYDLSQPAKPITQIMRPE